MTASAGPSRPADPQKDIKEGIQAINEMIESLDFSSLETVVGDIDSALEELVEERDTARDERDAAETACENNGLVRVDGGWERPHLEEAQKEADELFA